MMYWKTEPREISKWVGLSLLAMTGRGKSYTQVSVPKMANFERSWRGLQRFRLTGVRDAGTELGRGSYASVVELQFRGLKCAGKKLHRYLYDSTSPREQEGLLHGMRDPQPAKAPPRGAVSGGTLRGRLYTSRSRDGVLANHADRLRGSLRYTPAGDQLHHTRRRSHGPLLLARTDSSDHPPRFEHQQCPTYLRHAGQGI